MVNLTVMKVELHCDRCKKKLFKSISTLHGVDRIEISGDGSTLSVVGDANPIEVIVRVRKVCRRAKVESVGPQKPANNAGGDKKAAAANNAGGDKKAAAANEGDKKAAAAAAANEKKPAQGQGGSTQQSSQSKEAKEEKPPPATQMVCLPAVTFPYYSPVCCQQRMEVESYDYPSSSCTIM